MPEIPDLTVPDWTDELLEQLRASVQTEQERRYVIKLGPALVEEQASRYQTAIGRRDGDAWAQPAGAHDAYKLNAVVTHKSKTWESTTPNNVWEPGVSGWREKVAEGQVPDFIQPTGAHDAYKKGDKMKFKGAVYESLVDNNVYSPEAYAANWKKIG